MLATAFSPAWRTSAALPAPSPATTHQSGREDFARAAASTSTESPCLFPILPE